MESVKPGELISQSTQQQVSEKFVTRRVFRTPLSGFEGEHDLYQPFQPQMDVRELERIRKYEKALLHFENREFLDTLNCLVALEVEGTNDSAAEFLMGKTRDAIKSNSAGTIRISGNHSRPDQS